MFLELSADGRSKLAKIGTIFVLVNWFFVHEGIPGGCESFHEKLARVLKLAGHTVGVASRTADLATTATVSRCLNYWNPKR